MNQLFLRRVAIPPHSDGRRPLTTLSCLRCGGGRVQAEAFRALCWPRRQPGELSMNHDDARLRDAQPTARHQTPPRQPDQLVALAHGAADGARAQAPATRWAWRVVLVSLVAALVAASLPW